jgi:hypothetical protein
VLHGDIPGKADSANMSASADTCVRARIDTNTKPLMDF